MTDGNPDMIISLFPANGWRVRHHHSHDTPIVGWALLGDGRLEALVHLTSGMTERAIDVDCITVFHEDASDAHLIRDKEIVCDCGR